MPIMRDKDLGRLHDVPQKTLDRFPDMYEKPETEAKREARKRKAKEAKIIHVDPVVDDEGLPVTTEETDEF